MKYLYTLTVTLFSICTLHAQVILNEIYPIPGNNRQEFFELYNMSGSNTPVSVDNYTIVTYFEEGNKKGFYVLDLPNQSIAPRGYYVGSAASPFNYQGVTNCTNTNFSWNDAAFLSNNNGYLRKWVAGKADNTDGNPDYDLETIPTGFNNFFSKTGGNGATYSVFLYSNGQLVNAFFGGTGGNTNIPAFIKAMPPLYVDMLGDAPDFNINFAGYNNTNTPVEYVTQDVGTDNGYIRIRDGVCGSWEKSSAGVQHSPSASNGGQISSTGVISVEHAIVRGTALTGSLVNYNVVAAPLTVFPVTLMIYVDNGAKPGQLDGTDTFIESNVENTVSDGGFSTIFFPYNQNILIVVNTAQSCIDKVLFVPNAGVLPVKLLSFDGVKENGNTVLKWRTDENETISRFEVQTSADGRNFRNTGIVFATGKVGQEQYSLTDATEGTTFYRLKIVDKDNRIQSSKVIALNNMSGKTQSIVQVLTGGVAGQYVLSVTTSASLESKIAIYDISGKRVYTQMVKCEQGNNIVYLPSMAFQQNKVYVAEISNPAGRTTTKLFTY